MKFNSEIIKKAHQMAKEIKREFTNVDYRVQFGLCLSYLISNEKEDKKMKLPALEDSEKQIKWAEDIRKKVLEDCEFWWDIKVKGEQEYEKKRGRVNISIIVDLLAIKVTKNVIMQVTSAKEIIEKCRNEVERIGMDYMGGRKYGVMRPDYEKIKALRNEKTFDFSTLDEYFL